MRLKPFTSFFLDVLRVIAAVGVVLCHLGPSHLALGRGTGPAHLFVLCFFVLSGFVITATSSSTNSTAAHYFALRLARLWTVALPCLAIALALEVIGRHYAPVHYANFTRGAMLSRYALAALFLNENWFLSAAPMTVSPVWSLAYEAWFYVLFGIAIFVRPLQWRTMWLVVAAVVAGPKIMLLMPVWLLGSVTWKLCQKQEQLHRQRWWILAASSLLTALFCIYEPGWPRGAGMKPLFFSSAWLSDFIFGCGIAGTILAIDLICGNASVPSRLEFPFREIANVSFTLYMLHFPMMVFAAGLLPYDHSSLGQALVILLVIFALIYGIGNLIEPKRRIWTPKLEAIFLRLGKQPTHLPSAET